MQHDGMTGAGASLLQPAPGVWLAATARRTERLRFGPLAYLLPLYHPIKLLEES